MRERERKMASLVGLGVVHIGDVVRIFGSDEAFIVKQAANRTTVEVIGLDTGIYFNYPGDTVAMVISEVRGELLNKLVGISQDDCKGSVLKSLDPYRR